MAKNKPNFSYIYLFLVSFGSFVLATSFFSFSNIIAQKMQSLAISIIFIIIIILVGIVADILGVSVAAASEAPLHAKAAKKISGSTEGVYLIRNADRVANICADVVGDIAGTVSGALGIALALQIVVIWNNLNSYTVNMLLTGLIAAATVGGKAISKWIALTYSEEVVFFLGKIIYAFSVLTGRKLKKKTQK